MVTYKQIQKYVERNYGLKVDTCHIAHVKEIMGIPLRKAPNRKGKKRVKPCPENRVEPIKEAIMHLELNSSYSND